MARTPRKRRPRAEDSLVGIKVVEHTKQWVHCNKKPSYLWISSRLKLGLVSSGNQTNLEFERLSTTEFGVVAGEASTTLPGLWCECAKSRAARQNRRGSRRRRGRLSTVPSGPDPERSLTIKFERNRWRWSQMASAFGRSISHAVPGRRISTPFTEIGRDEGVNRGMSF